MIIESQELFVQKVISLNQKGIFAIIKIKRKVDSQDEYTLQFMFYKWLL